MGSGEPAYCIPRRIFANFLEPVIVLKISKFPDKILSVLAAIISSEMYVDPVNLKISIIGKYTASGFPFYRPHSTPSRNPSVL